MVRGLKRKVFIQIHKPKYPEKQHPEEKELAGEGMKTGCPDASTIEINKTGEKRQFLQQDGKTKETDNVDWAG